MGRKSSRFVTLSPEQIALVRIIWNSFAEHLDWPITQYIEDKLDDVGLRLNSLLQTLPRYRSVHYGPVWWQSMGPPEPDTKIGVTIAGLAHLSEAQPVVDVFVGVIRRAATRWREIPATPHEVRRLSLRLGDLVGLVNPDGLGTPLRLVRSIQKLLEHEPPVWRGVYPGPDESWRWDVGDTIRPFAGVADAWEYLDVLEDFIGEVDTEVATPATTVEAAVAIPGGVDAELWARIEGAVASAWWDQVVREATVFFEDHVRRWGGFAPDQHGVDLITAALHPSSGTMRLALEGAKSESDGWFHLARGLILAVRNAVVHRLDVFLDEQRAMGVVGTVSLLIGQIRRDYPEPLPPQPPPPTA